MTLCTGETPKGVIPTPAGEPDNGALAYEDIQQSGNVRLRHDLGAFDENDDAPSRQQSAHGGGILVDSIELAVLSLLVADEGADDGAVQRVVETQPGFFGFIEIRPDESVGKGAELFAAGGGFEYASGFSHPASSVHDDDAFPPQERYESIHVRLRSNVRLRPAGPRDGVWHTGDAQPFLREQDEFRNGAGEQAAVWGLLREAVGEDEDRILPVPKELELSSRAVGIQRLQGAALRQLRQDEQRQQALEIALFPPAVARGRRHGMVQVIESEEKGGTGTGSRDLAPRCHALVFVGEIAAFLIGEQQRPTNIRIRWKPEAFLICQPLGRSQCAVPCGIEADTCHRR